MIESSIQVASRLCGVGVHTLRAWEKRYGAVVPQRSHNGRRLYSEEDICKLQMLNELCHFGNSIGTIANYSTDELRELLSKFSKKERNYSSASSDHSQISQDTNASSSWQHLLLALDTYKLEVISHELNKLAETNNVRDLVFNVLVPFQKEVSKRVKQSILTCAQEIAILSMVKFHVGELVYSAFKRSPRGDKVFVLATSDNLQAEFGILGCALLCAHYRHRYFYFCNDLSVDALVQSVMAVGASHIILDTRCSHAQGSHDSLENFLMKLSNKLKKNQTVILFGDKVLASDNLGKHSQFRFLTSHQLFDDMIKFL